MTADELWTWALTFIREHETVIEVILFVLAFAESIIFASVFVPSSAIFIGIGALEGAAQGPLIPLIIAGALGALAGDLVSFAIGWRFREDIPRVWPLRNHPELLFRARQLFERWGTLAVVASKLTGPLRPIVPMLAGASHMPLPAFALASALSSIIWSVLVLAPSYYGLQLMMH